MINSDVTEETIKQHSPNWPRTDHLYRISIIGGSGSGKNIDYLI